MIRPTSSVIRTVQENIFKKPFSTSRVVRMDFNKKLQKLKREQMKAVGNDTPVYIRDGPVYFTMTCILGVITGIVTFQSVIKVFRAN